MLPNPDGDTVMHEGAARPFKDLAKKKYERNVKRRARKKASKRLGPQGYEERKTGPSLAQNLASERQS